MADADLVIPVYREGDTIRGILTHLRDTVKSRIRVLLCYDQDDDPTVPAALSMTPLPFEVIPVKNGGRGVRDAILTGFARSDAPAVIVYPADDDTNGPIVDRMIELFRQGHDIVAPSRFMKGGCMEGCRWLKAFLVRTAAFTLHHFAHIPTHDATNGFRLFSRRVIRDIPVESLQGFAFSIELLAKCHRMGWRISEVPSRWFERRHGKSRFRIFEWLPIYLKWYFYIFETSFGRSFRRNL